MFSTPVVVMVEQLFNFSKIHQCVHLMWMTLMICELYFKRPLFLKRNFSELSFLRYQMGKTKQNKTKPMDFICNSVGRLGSSGLGRFG